MNAKEALEKLYAGDYQTAEGAGELARIVSEALNDAESTQSLYYAALDRLKAIEKRAKEWETILSSFSDGKSGYDCRTMKRLIDFIIKGPNPEGGNK